MSDSLRPHGLQHARLPCPSPTPGVYSDSCHWVGDAIHLIPFHPLLFLSSVFPSIRVFSNDSVLHIRWPKYWRFHFNISPSNEHPGLISFRMDWFDLLVVQGTLKDSLQYHSSKAWILWCSAFFIVQLSHPYMTTGKTITLTRPWLDRPFPAYGVNKIWKNTLFKKWIFSRGLKDESIWAGECLGRSQLQVLR